MVKWRNRRSCFVFASLAEMLEKKKFVTRIEGEEEGWLVTKRVECLDCRVVSLLHPSRALLVFVPKPRS